MSDALDAPEDHPDGINPSLEDPRLATQLWADMEWLCGAFQPAKRPYRCIEPWGHMGPHRTVIDGEIVAEWEPTEGAQP